MREDVGAQEAVEVKEEQEGAGEVETSVEENPWRLLEPVGDTTTMTAEDHQESQVFKKIDPTKLNRLNLNGKL